MFCLTLWPSLTLEVRNWRLGLEIFATMVPVFLTPAIWTLYGVQRRADKLGAISFSEASMTRREDTEVQMNSDYLNLAWRGIIDADPISVIVLSCGFALVLLSFNLAKTAEGGWSNPPMIAVLVVGFDTLWMFDAFEIYFAPKPLITRRIFRNKAFI